MEKYLPFLVVCCFALQPTAKAHTPAQRHIDSLKNELRQNPGATEKAKIYGDLSWHYNSVSIDSAFHYGTQALEMAQKLQNRGMIAQTLSDLATIHYIKGDFEKSLELYDQALQLWEADGNEERVASSHFKIGNVYHRKAEPEKCIAHFMKALDHYEKTGDENTTTILYSNMGLVYQSLHNYPKALQFLTNAETYFRKTGNTGQLANTTLSLGNLHVAMRDTAAAINCFETVVGLARKDGNFIAEATAYHNLGAAFTDLGRPETAIDYIQQALAIRKREKLESDAASSNLLLATNLIKLRQYRRATGLLLESLDQFNKAGFGEKITGTYFQLIPAYAGLGKMDSVQHFMTAYMANRSAELNAKVIEVTNELETKYQTEKKERQIETLNQETAIQRLRLHQRSLLLGGAASLLAGIAVLVYVVQNRRKISAEARLQKQAAQAVLQAEERERRRIATDLHDGVGQLLSVALLKLNEAHDKIPQETDARVATESALALLAEGYDEMRNVSHQMMPNALLKAGLASSVREFVDKIDSQRLKVSLDVVGLDQRLDDQTETVLYRVIQEAVNNVVKHAEATKLSIQLIRDGDGISLTIEDNGQGFDKGKGGESVGIGLRNIQSRVALLNGMVDLDSAPGKGTLVAIHIPSMGNAGLG